MELVEDLDYFRRDVRTGLVDGIFKRWNYQVRLCPKAAQGQRGLSYDEGVFILQTFHENEDAGGTVLPHKLRVSEKFNDQHSTRRRQARQASGKGWNAGITETGQDVNSGTSGIIVFLIRERHQSSQFRNGGRGIAPQSLKAKHGCKGAGFFFVGCEPFTDSIPGEDQGQNAQRVNP